MDSRSFLFCVPFFCPSMEHKKQEVEHADTGKKCQGCAAACYAGNNVADEAGNGNDRCIRNLGRDMLHVVAACTGR